MEPLLKVRERTVFYEVFLSMLLDNYLEDTIFSKIIIDKLITIGLENWMYVQNT